MTGPDALMLIAAAANVSVKPIRGVDGNTIGFVFQYPESLPGRNSQKGALAPTDMQTSNPFSHLRINEGSTAHASPDAAGSADVTPGLPGRVRTYGDDRPRGGAGVGFSRFGSGGMGAGAGAYAAGPGGGIFKRAEDSFSVYPLGEIPTSIKFDEVEETLRDLLKTEGIAAEAAKLSFHQKTGVLVLRGPEEVHRLVQELLRALEQNTTHARENREKDASSDLARMQVKIESLTRELAQERERLERRSAEAEALARQYQNDLRKLQNSQQDKK